MSREVETPLPMIESLRTVPALSELNDSQLAWIAANSEERRYSAGEIIFHAGEPANFMVIVLEGEFETRRDGPGGEVIRFRAQGGDVTGMLPGSRLTHIPSNAYAIADTRLAALHKDRFWVMFSHMPELAPKLIAVLTDRVRSATKAEQQREKLAALGKLSAGLAHELNNPASAVRQGAATLRESIGELKTANFRLSQRVATPEQKRHFFEFEARALQRIGTLTPDPLERSDREQEVTDWMEARGVPEAWKFAPALVECAFDSEMLADLEAFSEGGFLPDFLLRFSATVAVEEVVREIEISAGRISDLVQAIKEYSFMDQSPEQEIDLHKGIEATLVMLGHKLKKGIAVVREYDRSLPRVCAHGSELNQVWTNLIDNSVSAMKAGGELRIRTRRERDWAVVEIADNGPGIPREVQHRIFEPFFTTKDVGEGTGLGLETVARIVKQHHGELSFDSKPGHTSFQVRLPLANAQPLA